MINELLFDPIKMDIFGKAKQRACDNASAHI